MESQQEITVAAEALRTWVRGQRASWSAPVPPARAGHSVVSTPVSPPVSMRVATPEPVHAAPPPAPVVQKPEPVVQAPPPAAAPVAPSIKVAPAPTAPSIKVAPAPVPVTPSIKPAAATAPVASSIKLAPAAAPPVVQNHQVHSPAPQNAEPAVVASVHFDADESEPSSVRRWAVPAAAVLVLLIAVAGGAYFWGRGSAGPKVGSAAFDSVPPGAQVFVDGKPVGSTPVRVELNPGPHAVEFKLKDATRTQSIEVAKGQEIAVNVDWKPRRLGGLQVTSTPAGARVLVDGKERGQTPVTLSDLPVGAHTVQIESSAGSVRRKVDIGEGRTETLAESIYPGWLHVSSPIDVTVVDGSKGVSLDDSNRVLLKPGVHTIRIENRSLSFSQSKQVDIEPGGTTTVEIEVPTSSLSVTGSTGAEVFVDGTKAGETPLADYQVKLGTRDIMVVDKSGVTRHASVTVTTKPAQLDISFGHP